MFILLLPYFLILTGCGSSGGEDNQSPPKSVGAGSDSAAEKIDKDNFLPIASSIYLLSSLDAVAPIITGSSELLIMELDQGRNSTVPCDVAGTTETRYSRMLSADEAPSAGDTITKVLVDCVDSVDTVNGTRLIEVLFDDEWEEAQADYSELILLLENDETITEKATGNMIADVSSVVAVNASYNDDEQSFTGVNIHGLDSAELASAFPSFEPFIKSVPDREFKSAFGSANFTRFSWASSITQVPNEDVFEETSEEINQKLWDIEVVYSDDNIGYRTYTLSPLIVRDVLSLDTFESEYFAQGIFNIEFETGEVVTVSSTFTDNTTVSFDAEGDGVYEAALTMSWEEFTEAFFFGAEVPVL